MVRSSLLFFFEGYGDHLDLHVLPHSFPTRLASDLQPPARRDIGVPRLGLVSQAGRLYRFDRHRRIERPLLVDQRVLREIDTDDPAVLVVDRARSEEHTSELQSLMRISYAVFCLKKKKTKRQQ